MLYDFLQLFFANLFWYILAIFFSCLEIEIEGKNGWAEKLPTWRQYDTPFAKLYSSIMSGRILTGYHLYIFALLIMVFHSPFFLGVKWSIYNEVMCWSLYFVFCPVWDLLWFILNPYYTVKKFKQDQIWWYKKSYWVLNKIPSDHIISLFLSIFLGLIITIISGEVSYLVEAGFRLIVFISLLIIVIKMSPKYHSLYMYLHKEI
jgi:hypothetical protein